jgi:RNA polymerase sigma-54 factor
MTALSQKTQMRTRMQMGAKLIAAGAILEMSAQELRQELEKEAATNPALEIDERALCPTCRFPLHGNACLSCALASRPLPFSHSRSSMPELDGNGDAMLRLPGRTTLQDHLMFQARLCLNDEDLPVAEYLIASLDDRGLLECNVSEAAAALGASTEQVERVASVLQTLDPPGVCARSAREAVLAQLSVLEEEGKAHPLAREILSQHWHDLAGRRFEKIARHLGVDVDDIRPAAKFIRTSLNPYPAVQFRLPWQPHSPLETPRPDAIIHRVGADYVAEVLEAGESCLRINASYRRLERYLKEAAGAQAGGKGRAAQEHLDRAKWLIHSLHMRRRTLREITLAIVELQRPFLDTGSRQKLRPLTRARLARRIGKHESTISRAIANKFVILPPPADQVVSYDIFFGAAAGAKATLCDILMREPREHPLTDKELCRVLAARGYRVARRTVTKYRLALRIPASVGRG